MALRGNAKDEIYYTQVVVLVAVIVFFHRFLAAARLLTPVAGTAAWISVVLGGLVDWQWHGSSDRCHPLFQSRTW